MRLYEEGNILKSPIEAFYYDANKYDFPIGQHWHYYSEVIYGIEDTTVVVCNDKEYDVKPNQLIFVPPETIHSMFSRDEKKPKYLVVKFDANRVYLSGGYMPRLSSIFRGFRKPIDVPILFSQEDLPRFNMRDSLYRLVDEINTKNYGYDSYINSILQMLMLEMFRKWHDLGLLNDFATSEDTDEYSFHDIIPYIDEHSDEIIKIEDLADMCGMSYSNFARRFKSVYGQSCKEYIEFIKLSRVEKFLLFTDYDLTHISTETGFSDCSHLIRVFKRKYGITPKQYKKIHLQKGEGK
ncbi:MAG: AraC family transcriptional regulator [Lachnospiraceae bacterium]|nr:AraC family transcriptional regulator [Lachnospiraceae bacterium]